MWVETERGDCWVKVYGLHIMRHSGDDGQTTYALRAVCSGGVGSTVAWRLTEAEARQLLRWFGEALLHDHKTFSVPFHLDMLRNGKEAVRDAG